MKTTGIDRSTRAASGDGRKRGAFVMGVSAEMVMTIVALLTVGSGGWKVVTEAKKIVSDVKVISGQVHNNHGSSMKDTVDKIAQRMASAQQTQETMSRVQEEQGEGAPQLRQSMTQMQRDMTQLREDLTVTTRRMKRIEAEEHETCKEIFDRLNKKGKVS